MDGIIFGSLFVQILTVLMLNRLPVPNDSWRKYAACIYWLSPLVCLSTVLSPIPSMIHFLVLLIACAVHYRRSVCALFLLSLLVTLQKDYYPLFVVVGYALISSAPPMSRNGLQLLLRQHGLLLVLYVVAGLWLMHTSVSSPTTSPQAPPNALSVVHPSFGVWWYLHAQVFSGYAAYFCVLVSAQPFLYLLPLCIRLPNTSLLPVSTHLPHFHTTPPHNVLNTCTVSVIVTSCYLLVQYFVTVAIIVLFGRESAFCDVVFVACCLLRYSNVLAVMRHKELLVLVILVTMAASPVMLSLWVEAGSGNANYLFFQSIAMCIAYAFLLVEFVRSAMKLRKTSKIL
jgi:hypothetical protein